MDPNGTNRAPLHIARSIQAAYDAVTQISADTIPQLEVLYDSSSIDASSYNKGGGPDSAVMRVAGAGNANPDAWDTNVVQRVYAHHVLASIAAAQSTPFDAAFDAVSDDQNAFAEGFGYYLASLLSGSPYYYDTVNSNTATTIDLENPQISTRKGGDVTAWVAAALYDLLDGPNEAWDEVDGTGFGSTRPIQVVDAMTSAPTVTSFYVKWGALGFPSPEAVVRDFIRHGVVGDDALEPNDRLAEATAFAAPGFRRSNMVLNPFNEDWYQFQLGAAAAGLTADVSADFIGDGASITLELRNAADQVVAAGVMQQGNIAMKATVPGISPAGVYRVRVRHDSGPALHAYAVQAYTPLMMTSEAFRPWTVNRPYNVTLSATGGVPPYSVTIEQPFVKPPGLFLDSANLRVSGQPTVVGTHNFVLSVRDDGDPVNVASVPQSFVVNDVLAFHLGQYVAFPLGKPVNRTASFTGGTSPFSFTLTSGAPPSGLQLDLGDLRFQGTPDEPGSSTFSLDGIDAAFSTDSAEVKSVVTVPLDGGSAAADLAAGDSACGFFFDAVHGSTVSFAAKTAKKRIKRAIHLVVIDPSGNEMQGLVVKDGTGKASVSGIPCDQTGRYQVVIAGISGEATQLLGSAKTKLPKKASGSEFGFTPGKALDVTVGALAGAHVTLTIKPDKSGLSLRGNVVRKPSGAVVAFQPGEIVEKGTTLVFSKDLDEAGTWTFSFVGKPGPTGSLKWSLKIAQPKGGTYSAD